MHLIFFRFRWPELYRQLC